MKSERHKGIIIASSRWANDINDSFPINWNYRRGLMRQRAFLANDEMRFVSFLPLHINLQYHSKWYFCVWFNRPSPQITNFFILIYSTSLFFLSKQQKNKISSISSRLRRFMGTFRIDCEDTSISNIKSQSII